jgi:ferredoxin
MTTALIVGSGAAAAGAALALSHRENVAIDVIDIGLNLEPDRERVIAGLASSSPDEWDEQMIRLASAPPAATGRSRVPEKRRIGSDYPFRNVGQLDGLTAGRDVNPAVISPAYGGFSTVWGAQIMPFASAAFESWPVSPATMRHHYEAILRHLPFAGEEDDLMTRFPLMRQPAPLPPMSPRSRRVLHNYENHRAKLNARGVTVGKARLAFDPANCSRCGMCMTGCPYGLIYSAAQTFDALRRAGKVTLHRGLLAIDIREEASEVTLTTRELATGRTRRFEADHVYVACGAIGTARLVASSLRLFNCELPLLESRQFVLPLLSRHATEDPRGRREFTLNQFNVIVAPDSDAVNVVTLHCYTFNPAFVDALPRALRARSAEGLQAQLLRRLSVAFGYLPSWHSSRLRIHIGRRGHDAMLPDCHVASEPSPRGQGRALRAVLQRLARAGRLLDLYPLIPMARLSPAGGSYHWGGTFPHTVAAPSTLSSDSLGRVGPWRRTHLVDASVFPAVPAMTFGLTVMANAHRIAAESVELA